MVTEVVGADVLMGRTEELAAKLKRNSPAAMAATKGLLLAQNKAWVDAAIEASLEANAKTRKTEDLREGIAAFLAKRTPVWGKQG